MANTLQYTAGQRIVFKYNDEIVEGETAFDSAYQWGDQIGVYIPLRNLPAGAKVLADLEKHPEIVRVYYGVSPENVITIDGGAA